jgi:hypothetical protein
MKARFVAAAIEHREADRYLKGTYASGEGTTFRACSVGCSLATVYGGMDSNRYKHADHGFLSETLGVPEFITYLQDTIFEGLPDRAATEWTERLFSAIPVGADLSLVQPAFLAAVQRRLLKSIDRDSFPSVYAAVEGVIAVLDDWTKTGRVNESAAESAAESARSAARYAAWSAWSAARSAARSARYAESTGSAARSAEYQWMAGTLVRLIGETGHA